jgi:hypothetical protein
MSDDTLHEMYDRMGYEVVEVHDELKVPTSKGVRFETSQQIEPNEAVSHFDTEPHTPIGEYMEERFLSTKVYDSLSNEFFHLKVWDGTTGIYPVDDDFGLKTFKRAVGRLKELADLEFIDENDCSTDTDT